MVNTRLDAGFSGTTALLLTCLGCTSLQDLSSYSEGAAGAAGLPVFQPPGDEPDGELDDEPSVAPPDASASVVAAEGQDPANVPLIPLDTNDGADDCTAEGEFTDAASDVCYVTLAEVSSWRDARDACQEWGGELARVDSAEENGLLSEHSEGDVWLGASDFEDEGNFRWVDGDAVDDDNWGAGQPDNFEGRENCVELRESDDNWNDVPCLSQKRGVCERALPDDERQ